MEVDLAGPCITKANKHYNEISAAVEPARQKEKWPPQQHLKERYGERDEGTTCRPELKEHANSWCRGGGIGRRSAMAHAPIWSEGLK